MKTNYVLIDFENVQPKNLDLLHTHDFRVLVFVGEHQKNIPLQLAEALQKLGEKGSYIRIKGNGRNALDFHIAFTLGQLSEKDPTAFFMS